MDSVELEPQMPEGLKETSLAAFLEENQRVITVLGIFTALTVFASNLKPAEFGGFLSSLFLTLALLIWLELWGRFPPERGSWRLYWFENLLGLGILVLVGYWIVSVHVWLKNLITLLIWCFTLAGVSGLMRRYGLFNRVFRTGPDGRRRLRYGLGLLLQLVALAVATIVATVAGPPIDRLLDQLTPDTFIGSK